jgi:hypothetical protein
MRIMYCLSVKQPWAEALLIGAKSIEVRTWWPRVQLPMFIAIHAGKSVALDAPANVWNAARMKPSHPSMVSRLGGIIGAATLVERIDFSLSEGKRNWQRYAAEHMNPLDWWADNLVGLRFADPVRFPRLLPLRGRLGLFEVHEDMARAVEQELARATSVAR